MQVLEGLSPVLDDERGVRSRRNDRVLVEQQMNVRAAAAHPYRAVAQRLRRIEQLVAEQRPESHMGVDLLRKHFERHVLEHRRQHKDR